MLHGLQGGLQRFSDLPVDDLGGGTGHGGGHGDHRELQGRDQLLFELPGQQDAEHRREDGDQRDQGSIGQGETCQGTHDRPVRSEGAVRPAAEWRQWPG